MRAALELGRDEFNDLSLYELTQFSFAKGEQALIGMSHQGHAVFKAIDGAFSDEPGHVFEDLWIELMGRVNYAVELSDDDYKAHNDSMAEQLTGLKSRK